jgi:hypothetical protein
VLGLFVASGDSRSKLGPPEGVVDPVRAGDSTIISLLDVSVVGVADLERSRLSEMARMPDSGLFTTAESQSGVNWCFDELDERAGATEVSSFVTVGDGASAAGGIFLIDSVVAVDAVLL